MAGMTRLELATFGMTGHGLAYFHHFLESFRAFFSCFGVSGKQKYFQKYFRLIIDYSFLDNKINFRNVLKLSVINL